MRERASGCPRRGQRRGSRSWPAPSTNSRSVCAGIVARAARNSSGAPKGSLRAVNEQAPECANRGRNSCEAYRAVWAGAADRKAAAEHRRAADVRRPPWRSGVRRKSDRRRRLCRWPSAAARRQPRLRPGDRAQPWRETAGPWDVAGGMADRSAVRDSRHRRMRERAASSGALQLAPAPCVSAKASPLGAVGVCRMPRTPLDSKACSTGYCLPGRISGPPA